MSSIVIFYLHDLSWKFQCRVIYESQSFSERGCAKHFHSFSVCFLFIVPCRLEISNFHCFSVKIWVLYNYLKVKRICSVYYLNVIFESSTSKTSWQILQAELMQYQNTKKTASALSHRKWLDLTTSWEKMKERLIYLILFDDVIFPDIRY